MTSPIPATVLVTTTLADEAAALGLARALVESRLAACVHVAPVTSVYRWQGDLEQAREWSCQIKTTRGRLGELLERVKSLHPYQVPEILTVDIAGGDPAYLRWLDESVRDS